MLTLLKLVHLRHQNSNLKILTVLGMTRGEKLYVHSKFSKFPHQCGKKWNSFSQTKNLVKSTLEYFLYHLSSKNVKYFHEIFAKKCEGKFPQFLYINTTVCYSCGNFENLISHIFGKNFVKATCLLNNGY